MRQVPMYGGMPVVVSYDRPGYRLPDDMLLPLKFREEFNAWAAAFFRPKPSPIPDGQVIFANPGGLFGPGGQQQLHMNQRTYAQFLKATKES